MKKFVTLFYLWLKNQHLTKDVWLIPYYMHKINWYESKIVTPKQNWEKYEDLEIHTKGLKIKTTKGLKIWFIDFGLILYLIRNSREIDILNMFHFSLPTLLYGLVYKATNRKWKIYMKMDLDIQQFKHKWDRIYNFWNMINVVLKPIENLLINICNIISVEAEDGLSLLIKYNEKFRWKLIRIPNGADDINIKKIIKNNKSYNEKENIIITVWRIWTYQKNTEMLLNIIKNIDLKEWKIKIIWPIDDPFLQKISDFFGTNHYLEDKVEFVWTKTKKEVYEYYDRAKIFVLTSRREWFANTFPEALYFWDHIITTNVSGAEDITKNSNIWDIVDIENHESFAKILQGYIDNQTLLVDKYIKSIEYSKKYFVRSKIINKLNKIFYT